MKHVVIDLNEETETILFHNFIMGNYDFDTYNKVIPYEMPCIVESLKNMKPSIAHRF